MTKWTIVYTDGQIGKDGYFYSGLDMSWLPSTILAVQSPDGVTCEIEHGDRATETHTHNEVDVSTSSLAWWSNVGTAWQSAYEAEQAEIAAYDAEQAEIAASEDTPE